MSDNDSCLTTLHAILLQAGSLAVGGDSHPLYKGINIIGRRSHDENHQHDRVVDWRVDHGGGVPVSALLLRFAAISSKHAIICESEYHGAWLLLVARSTADLPEACISQMSRWRMQTWRTTAGALSRIVILATRWML